MALDIFDKLKKNRGPIGQYAKGVHGYFTFPKLEGEISNRMIFQGKERVIWSLNNYLGLANHPEVRKADAEAAAKAAGYRGIELGPLEPVRGLKPQDLAGRIVLGPPGSLADRWSRRLGVACNRSGLQAQTRTANPGQRSARLTPYLIAPKRRRLK